MANSGKYLETWQYAGDSAYILLYYVNEIQAVRIEIWDEELKARVGSVDLNAFTGDVARLKFFSVNDVVYITEETMRPKKLVREDDATSESGYKFTLSDFDIKIDPVLDEYFDRNVFTVLSGTFSAGDTLRVTEKPLTDGKKANGANLLFTSEGLWRATGKQMLMLRHSTEQTKTWGLLYTGSTSNGSAGRYAITATPQTDEEVQNDKGGEGWESEWIFAYGSISVESHGKWSGRIVVDLWKPDMELTAAGEPESPEELAIIEVHNAMNNVKITRDLKQVGSRIRLRCERRERARAISATYSDDTLKFVESDNDTGCYLTLSNAQEIPVYLRIRSITPPTSTANGFAICEAIHPFEGGFTTSSFAEGAWCGGRYGYPKVCGVFQERMVFGGNKMKPCTLWCSKTGDWANFVQGSDSSSPVFATANTDNLDEIQWIQIAKSYILFGSLSGEWYFGGEDGAALKPSNYVFQRLSNFGSTAGIDAVLFGDSSIVAKNGGREVVDVSYNTLSEQGAGTNLSLYAAHLLENTTIAGLCCTSSPTPILWVLTADGDLLSFTYDGANNVFAWARHEILNGVEAMTAFRRGERDMLALLVRDGAVKRRSKLMLAELDPFRGDEYDPDSTDEDTKEHVFMDEKSDGTFTRYESRVIPTPILANDSGSAYGRKVAFVAFDIYLKTHNGDFDGEVWADGTEFELTLGEGGKTWTFDNGFLKNNVKRSFGENRIVLPMNTGWSDCALMDIRTDYPAPLTITAIGAEGKFSG